MYENIRNPYRKNLNGVISQLRETLRPKDLEIEKAYHRIVYQIRLYISAIPEIEKRKYLEAADRSNKVEDHMVKEFVCSFCSVSLKLCKGDYQIIFTVGYDTVTENEVNHNNLIRIAYKLTMNEEINLCIENCLKFELADDQRAYFLNRLANHNPATELLSHEILTN